MRSNFKVSIAAMPIEQYRTVDDFAAHVDRYAAEASTRGSDVLLLPELTAIGLLWGEPDVETIANAEIGAFYRRGLMKRLASYRQALLDVAKSRGVWLAGATYWHEREGRGANTGFVVSPSGQLEELDKVHPTRPEQVIGTIGGTTVKAYDMSGIKVGVLICYDVQFPELSRALLKQGIEVLLVPSLTSARGYWRVRYAAHSRAQENQIYVCVSPLIGMLNIPIDHPSICAGHSYVTCPVDDKFNIENGLFAESRMNEEALLHSVLDLDLLRLSRSKGEIRNVLDRRPDIYSILE